MIAAGGLLPWAVLLAGIVPASAAKLLADFVYLRDIDPTIQQDIRYAGSNNFVGRPLPRYEAAECIVRRDVALRLQAAQTELRPRGLSLKMLDCYRPVRAVAEMLAWSEDGVETTAGRRYMPGVAKRDLFRLGYIAVRSSHSTGAALDLTLVELAADNTAVFDPAKDYADCTAPAALRAPEGSVDMGTGYDCFDGKAHTAARDLTPEQRRWRNELVTVMARQGFVNYAREWWHFSLPGAGTTTYVFPIRPRR
ncbi:M15 family metallopeptidase [Bradyrhizobium sp. USDA 4353]